MTNVCGCSIEFFLTPIEPSTKQMKKNAKLSYEQVLAQRTKRGKYVAYAALWSVVGGVVLAITAKQMKNSTIAPSNTFYAYKRRLLSGKSAAPGEKLIDEKVYNDMTKNQVLIIDQDIDWNKFLTFGAIGAVTGILLFKTIFVKRLVTCPPNRYLIIYKAHKGHNYDNGIFNTMLEEGQTQFVYPIFQDYGFLTRENIPIQMKEHVSETRDKMKVSLSLEMNIGVTNVATEVCYASAKHLNKKVPEMSKQANEILAQALTDNIATFSSEEIDKHSDDFFIYIQQLIGWYTRYLGYAVRDCELLSVKMGTLKIVRKDLMPPNQSEDQDDH
jgi:hypothetical protein